MREAYRVCLNWPIALVLTVSLALIACTPADDDRVPNAARSSSPTQSGPTPEERLAKVIAKFAKQKLPWGGCVKFAASDRVREAVSAPGLRCARLKVPLDYTEPDGTTVTVAVLRRKASNPGKRIGALLINPGGPGGSGVLSAARKVSEFAETAIGRRFDIVGFDPRGVGASRPAVHCLTDAERDADRADISEIDGSARGVAKQEKEMRSYVRKCVKRTKYGKRMLAYVGTREVVRDMDVLRAALGDEKLTYLGYSYGTLIGYVYASTFPDNVRAMILDGALDPDVDPLDAVLGQAKGFGNAFDKFTEWCARQVACSLGSDSAVATRRFQKLARPLIDHKLPLADGRNLSYGDAINATIAAMYDDAVWEFLNAALTELAQGQGERLMFLADFHFDRDADGSYSGRGDASSAIGCVDSPAVTDRDAIRKMNERWLELAPFADSGLAVSDVPDVCAYWPVEQTLERDLTDLSGIPPVLVISTTGDPATPYKMGGELAAAMGGRLLTYVGKRHTAFGHDIKCVDTVGVAYLTKLVLPKEGKRCR